MVATFLDGSVETYRRSHALFAGADYFTVSAPALQATAS